MHFVAPSFSGETALAILLGSFMIKEGWKVFYIPAGPTSNMEEMILRYCGETYDSIVRSKQRVCVIIDEAHALFSPAHEGFWSKMKSHEGNSSSKALFLFVGDVRKIYTGVSNYRFSHQVPSEFVFGTSDELNELIKDFIEVSRMDLSPGLAEVIKSVCGNHLGVLRTVLCMIFESCRHSRNLDMDIRKCLMDEPLHYLLDSTRIIYHPKELSPEERKILSKALDGPVVLPRSVQSEEEGFAVGTLPPYDHLVSLGILRNIKLSPSFSNLSDLGVEYASPSLRRIIRNSLFSSLTRPESPPASLRDFLVDAIRMINVRLF